jgi:hypothetical protein
VKHVHYYWLLLEGDATAVWSYAGQDCGAIISCGLGWPQTMFTMVAERKFSSAERSKKRKHYIAGPGTSLAWHRILPGMNWGTNCSSERDWTSLRGAEDAHRWVLGNFYRSRYLVNARPVTMMGSRVPAKRDSLHIPRLALEPPLLRLERLDGELYRCQSV